MFSMKEKHKIKITSQSPSKYVYPHNLISTNSKFKQSLANT